MWYNCFVKKKLLLTTSLCALILGGSLGATFTANAEAMDSYPSDFTRTVTFTELKDYAVNGEEYIFLDGQDLYKLGGGSYEKVDCGEKTVTAVGWKGEFFYSADGGNFTLNGETTDITAEQRTSFTLNNYYYYVKEGAVKVLDERTDEVTSLDGFDNLKNYGNKAFAVKENAVYEIDGVTPISCRLEYSDFSDTLNIAVGDTADKLNTYNIETPHFVKLKSGAYLTEIDAESLGETFTAGKTVKVGEEVTAQSALLLCKTGNSDGISIVMIADGAKSKCYMMRTDSTTEVTRTALSTELDKNRATVTISKGYMYSSPYVCGITQLAEINAGELFEIVGIAKKQTNPELVRDFYLVKTAEGQTGYVPLEYVSLFTYVEKDPAQTVDPDYSEEDEVKSVVLIIIVIALVLIALGYMVFVGTSKKKDDKKKSDDKSTDKKKKKDKKK